MQNLKKRSILFVIAILLIALLLMIGRFRTSAPPSPNQIGSSPAEAAPVVPVALSESAITPQESAQKLKAPLEAKPTRDAAIDMQSLAAFDEWANQLLSHVTLPMSPETFKIGLERAQQRHAAMTKLIERDPQEALKHAVPYNVRSLLPDAIAGEIEKQIDGRGDLLVAVATDTTFTQSSVFRTAIVDGTSYKAYVYGDRLGHRSGTGLSLHGIALGNSLAVQESPIRVLAQGELPNPKLPILNEDFVCPVSGIKSRDVAVDAGGVIIYLCCAGHIGAVEKKLNAGETLVTAWGEVNANSGPLALSGPLESSYTTGTKSVLYIRAIYSDDPVGTNPQDDASCNSMFTSGNTFFQQTSYGLTGMTWVLSTVVTLPQPQSYYLNPTNGDSALYSDAVAAAKAAGFDNSQYDRECVRFNNGPGNYGGQAYVGARGCWMKSSSAGVLCHELGHNYGLWHANYWNATGDSIIGPGSNQEYGNPYDTMGSANAGNYQYNTYEKNLLGWLPDTAVSTFSDNGTYRIYPFDNSSLIAGNMYAVKVQRDSTRYYWLDYRALFTTNLWEVNGAEVLWSPWANSNNGSQILDTTPSTSQGKNDSAVTVGRTFADTNAGIYVTTVAKNAGTPPSLDIVVNTGTFPGNQAPTLTVAASATSVATGVAVTLTGTAADADGDKLAYYWDYGDGTFSIDNKPTETKSWTTVGDYRVHCIVSDMKGGTATASIIVTVGTPTKFRLSGTVTLGGVGMANVRVSDGTLNTYTDNDGTYTLVGEAAGSKTLNAFLFDATFTPGFTNPVSFSANTSGLNFTAVTNTYKLTGSVKDGTVGVVGATVSDGTHSAVTDSSGNYTITGIPNGIYTFLATKAGYQFQTVQPVEIIGADVTLNFTRLLYSVIGQISGGTTGAVVDIGDGIHTGVAGMNSFYSIQVPPGTWNLKATLSGYTISPSNFTNPLNVNSGSLSNQNFSAVAGTTYSIAGNISAAGSPLPGVIVSTGSKSSTTDHLGNYIIQGLANGAYTLTPTFAGATFTPTSLAATVASANLTAKNFTAQYPFTITTKSPLALGVVARPYTQTLDAVAGQGALTWSINSGTLPPGLTLIAAGTIGGTPTASGLYSFTLTATDSSSASTSVAMLVTVNPKLSVATSSLPSGTQGTAYSKTMSASGGLPPYHSWSISPGSLPTGLSLSSTGVISGTPTTPGTSTFMLTVKDSTNFAAQSSSLTLTINPTLAVTTTVLPAGTAGAAYSAPLATSGGTAPFTWIVSAGALPGGLTLSTTGIISGTPAVAGAPSFTVTATDAAGAKATKVLTVTINPTLLITTNTLPSFNVGAAYTENLAVSGGTGAATYSIQSGMLPTGMSISAGGMISGTSSTDTSQTFTVKATDTVGAVAMKTFVLTADEPLTIVPAAPPSGEISTPYTFTFLQTGGTPPLTWSIGSGTLPDGMNLSNGVLSGTPTNAGTFSISIALADAAAHTTSLPVTLTIINLPPIITSGVSATPTTQTVGESVSFAVAASDPEAATLAYSWDFGDAQTDTSSSPSHAYAAAGTYTVTVVVTDSGGLTVSSSTAVTITDPVAVGGGTPGTSGNPIPMIVAKVQGVVKPGGGHDAISISGTIPNVAKGFDPTGKTMVISTSGATITFTLNAHGQAKTTNGNATLKFKPALRDKVSKKTIFQGGPVPFTIKLAKGTWSTGWGIDPNATAAGKTDMTSTITLDGTVYSATTTVNYSTKTKSGGKFKK